MNDSNTDIFDILLSPGPSPKSFGATLDPIKFQTYGTRSPTTLEDRPKRPRFEDNSISQFPLCPEDLSIDLSLSSTDSFPPTSPESGVDLQYSPSNNAFFRTSMEGILSHITDNLSRPPHIQILEEPEQNYRPRYDCEGHRAPMKSRRNKSSHPSIKIVNAPDHTTGFVEVSLVQVDNTQSFPSCNLSGETKKPVGSSRELSVKFSDLRIQRVINNDTNRKATKGKSNQARLMFCANLETVNGPLKLETCSQPITLEPAQGQSTLSAIVPARGSAKGGDEFVLLGHKFTSPCEIWFSVTISGQEWKECAEICKDKFPPAKNAILAKTPRFFQCELKKPVTVEVCVISGKDKLKSESSLQYTYVPADGGIATSESLLQCALPLISEGQKLLEPPPTSFSVPTSSNGAFIQPNMHNSPLPDSWPEPLPTNSVPIHDSEKFPFPPPQTVANCLPPLSSSSAIPPCSPFYSQNVYSPQPHY